MRQEDSCHSSSSSTQPISAGGIEHISHHCQAADRPGAPVKCIYESRYSELSLAQQPGARIVLLQILPPISESMQQKLSII